jgi:phosphoadenosine phosphosulfate reductase
MNREEGLSTVAGLMPKILGLPTGHALREVLAAFSGKAVLATSLGAEDQVLIDLLHLEGLSIPIFTLDTGRLFPETYDLMVRTEERYGCRIQVFLPDAGEVKAMVAEAGINLFLRDVPSRRRCCEIRKLRPLARALSGQNLWICGLRREQSVTRQGLQILEWDEANGLVKFNPLHDWTEAAVWDHVRRHEVPYNPLHDKGFPSIGCACCTRAVAPGEDPRGGRWWWEHPEHRECGLHWVDGTLIQERKNHE